MNKTELGTRIIVKALLETRDGEQNRVLSIVSNTSRSCRLLLIESDVYVGARVRSKLVARYWQSFMTIHTHDGCERLMGTKVYSDHRSDRAAESSDAQCHEQL